MIWLLANWRWVAGAAAVLAIAASIWGYGHAQYRAGYAACDNAHRIAEQKARDAQQAQIAILDRKHTDEMEKAKAENDKLRADIAAGVKRLSVRVRSDTASGVGHAETRADIDPRDASALVAIANRGDDAIRQLTGCQDYVRAIQGQ